MNPIIQVEGLKKQYGDFMAVNGISFTVQQGEVFGLLGPNGAGKTTTLEIVETLRKPTAGKVLVDGISIFDNPSEIRKRIGIQLQSSDYYPNLNLREILEMFGALYGYSISPDELLKKVGLQDKAKSQYTTLSGGQKQRFSICTTLVNIPKIIFLDEPTTGLDPQARRNLWDLIREIRSEGVTIVLTTHYMEEAEELADRVAIIDQGKILDLDTPENLIEKLLKKGFTKEKKTREATLEDVFLDMTGRDLRE